MEKSQLIYKSVVNQENLRYFGCIHQEPSQADIIVTVMY